MCYFDETCLPGGIFNRGAFAEWQTTYERQKPRRLAQLPYLRCDGRNRLDSVEELHLLVVITDVLLNQKAVRLRVDVLHRHLEPVESASLGHLVYESQLRLGTSQAVYSGSS